MSDELEIATGVRVGDVLVGKYRVERVLGAGGMGVVVAARHVQLEERVALKFLLPHALVNSETVFRFLREARAAAKIKSEHVARVSDVGELENGSPYMVMEYLDGIDLSAWLAQRGALPVEQAVEFVLQACEALAEAHVLGIVHRDLKPANLFCIERPDGGLSVKVLDFGISKITRPDGADGGGHDMTRTTAFLGSPLYMSPEQMKMSKGVDLRTDIWSLGIILYELVAGRPPFEAEAVTELAIKVATQAPAPIRAILPTAPAALEPVLAKCLEKDREKRFASVGELALALRPLSPLPARASVERVLGTLRRAADPRGAAAFGGATGAAVSVAGADTISVGHATSAAWGTTARGTRSRGKAIAALAVVLGACALATAGLATRAWRKAGADTKDESTEASARAPLQSPPPTPVVGAQSPVSSSAVVSAAVASAASSKAAAPPLAPAAAPRGAPSAAASEDAKPRSEGAAPPPRPRPHVSGATPEAHPRPSCDPPYDLDAKGTRLFKKECL